MRGTRYNEISMDCMMQLVSMLPDDLEIDMDSKKWRCLMQPGQPLHCQSCHLMFSKTGPVARLLQCWIQKQHARPQRMTRCLSNGLGCILSTLHLVNAGQEKFMRFLTAVLDLICRSQEDDALLATAASLHAAELDAVAKSSPGGKPGIQLREEPYRLRAIGHSLGGASLLIYVTHCRRLGRPHHIHRLVLLTPAGFLITWPLVRS